MDNHLANFKSFSSSQRVGSLLRSGRWVTANLALQENSYANWQGILTELTETSLALTLNALPTPTTRNFDALQRDEEEVERRGWSKKTWPGIRHDLDGY